MAIIKVKFDRAIEGATNIVDSGTEGTRVATGTTAQRGSTAGQIRFNSDTGLAEYYTGSEFKAIDVPPTVTAVSPTEVASLDSGDATITITGTNFQSGATVKFIANDNTSITASSVTVNSSTSITAVAPNSSFSNTKEPYDVQVTNTNNLLGILNDCLNIDNTVAWNTASGSIASIYTTSTGTHVTVSATDPDGDTISYSETGGTVLSTAGLTLNSSTGAISGTPTSGAGTLNFTLRATANSKTADRNFSITVTAATPTDFLVLAGGGSGAEDLSGGGGAGGLRSSYGSTGGGGTAESSLFLLQGETYTITVGAGYPASDNNSGSGSNSSISGTGITTITSIGGGEAGGSTGYGATSNDGQAGGCGGGARYGGVGGSGTANQGYNGGDPVSAAGGGGGGTGSAGSNASSSYYGGAGGNGTSNSITGSAVTYGGGGGGASYNGYTQGAGGSGGGGNGSNTQNAAGQDGSANLGGGGGGGGNSSNTDVAAGGSGVVILRLLASAYTGTTTGSPTVTDDGSYKVLKYTGSGSYTA